MLSGWEGRECKGGKSSSCKSHFPSVTEPQVPLSKAWKLSSLGYLACTVLPEKNSRPGSRGVKNSVRMVLTARIGLAHLTPWLRFQPAMGTLEHRFNINGRFFHFSTSSAVCSVTGCLKVCKGIGWSQCSVQYWMLKETRLKITVRFWPSQWEAQLWSGQQKSMKSLLASPEVFYFKEKQLFMAIFSQYYPFMLVLVMLTSHINYVSKLTTRNALSQF